MSALIALLVFLAVMLFVLSLDFIAQDLKRARREKLIECLTAGQARSAKTRQKDDQTVKVDWVTRTLARHVDLTQLEDLLRAAQGSLSVQRFIVLSLSCGGITLLFPLLLFPHPALAAPALAGGLLAPTVVLRILKVRRDEALIRQLPEAIDTIVRSLRAGQSVDAAILEVAHGLPPPIGVEFRTVHEEMAMGLPFETVLKNLQRRFSRLSDVRILCVTFIIQRETGGNLTEILAGLAATIRERFTLKRQVRAATAEGRATALILGIMPMAFAGLTWVMKPDYVGVFLYDPLGRKLFMAAILLELAGFLLMRALSRVKL